MPTYRFPYLSWEDFEGSHTASLVEYDPPVAAVGRTLSDAAAQLKAYIVWMYEEYPWQAEPDFLDARLVHFKVAVRPEYRVENRIFPGDEPILLRIACVHGRQEGGLLVCALPILGIRFYYYEARSLKELVTTYVQESLKGMTPLQLSGYLPPKSVMLDEIVLHIPRKERSYAYKPDLSTLTSVAEPLGEPSMRRQYSQAWEREREVADLAERISKEKANVIIVGETGSGKTTLLVNAVRSIERQAEKIEEGETPHRQRYWLTGGGRLIAGMQYLGQWEARCERVIEELSDISGALAVGNLLDLIVTASREPQASIAAFLMPYLERGELQLIAEATPAELDACRRLLPGLVDLFQVLNLEPFDRAKSLSILNRSIRSLELSNNIEAETDLAGLVYRLFHRFVPYQAFPGKTILFLSDLFERARLAHSLDHSKSVSADAVTDQFTKQTGLPELFLRDDLPMNRSEVVEYFSRRIIGQEDACRAGANLVTTFKAGLNDPGRPIGVMLFCGPTGVGKTELARSISEFIFGHGEEKDRLVRLDMSEYSGAGAAERLISNSDGLPGELIKRMRRQPFAVVLLDEIEKADPEVFDVLLSVFDEGRLTDRFGRATTFRSAIIIMTSNIGADKLQQVGFDNSAARSYSAEAQSFFRPEFFNRIDRIVRFDALDEEKILAITGKELSEISKREGLSQAGIRLTWTERLVKRLAREGFDARYGARPLQRTIEQMIVAPLARFLIEHADMTNVEIQADIDEGGQIILDRNNRI